jgi:hypothetical protein
MMNPEFILVVLQGLPLLSGGIFAILMKKYRVWVVEIVTKCFRKKSIDEIPRDFLFDNPEKIQYFPIYSVGTRISRL